MRKDYTSGQTSKALNSYNTAIAHLSTMRDHVHDSDFVDLNNPTSDTYRRMALDKQLVSTELAKAVSANQMTEKEKGDILNSITSYTTHGYEQKIQEAVSLLKGKLDSYQNQWDNGAPPGAVSQLHMISPQAEHAINHIYSDDPSEPANTKQVKPQVSIQPPNSASTTAGGQTLQAQSGSVSHDQILQGIIGPGGAHPIAYADGPQGRLIKMQAGGPWIPLAGNLAAGR
jgi:hypothetical protein